MEQLTENQMLVFFTIRDYILKYGYSPTIRELCVKTGKKSPATIHATLKILKRKGYIDYTYNHNRTIRINENML